MIADLKKAAKARTEEALTTLVEVMQSAKSPAGARVSAATAILDRGWGNQLNMFPALRTARFKM
jgi:hypothetical protein